MRLLAELAAELSTSKSNLTRRLLVEGLLELRNRRLA